MPKRQKESRDTAANVGYEAQLWQMADALRGSMDAAEYKHVCLGLLFLKYISKVVLPTWRGPSSATAGASARADVSAAISRRGIIRATVEYCSRNARLCWRQAGPSRLG